MWYDARILLLFEKVLEKQAIRSPQEDKYECYPNINFICLVLICFIIIYFPSC